MTLAIKDFMDTTVMHYMLFYEGNIFYTRYTCIFKLRFMCKSVVCKIFVTYMCAIILQGKYLLHTLYTYTFKSRFMYKSDVHKIFITDMCYYFTITHM